MSAARHLLRLPARVVALFRRAATDLPWRLAVFGVLALCASWVLLSTAPALNEFRDAHVLGHYETAARDALLRWHQAPLWDPYYCGGMYLLGTPQARFVSPTFLLTLVFGESRGEAVTAFAMMIVGLEGTFRYARARGASSFGALLGAPVFALSGMFAVAPELGWTSFFGFELLPWIALGFRGALRGEIRGVLVTAVAMAWCACMGGTYSAPIAALWCAYEGFELLAKRARRKNGRAIAQALGFGLAAALLSATLAAVRLWPIADALADAPRIIGGTPSNPWSKLAGMLVLDPANDTENGAFFVGALALPAVALGLLRRRTGWLVVAAVLCAWLAAGYAVKPSLFGGLRHLPLYTTLRYPERFLVPFALALAALSARGVSSFEARVRRARRRRRPRRVRLLSWATGAAALALVVNVGPQVDQHVRHALARTLAPVPAADASRPFHQSRGNRWALAYYEPMQRGSLSCWEAYPVPESPLLRGDLDAEERVLDPGAGTVVERSWTPDRIVLDVDLARPATIAVNQNYAAGWRASVGSVESMRGLLTVAMPAGKQSLTLRFIPRSATGGALVSLAAIAALASLGWLTRRGRPARKHATILALAAIFPLVPGALVASLVHEQTVAEPALAPDGRPVVADAPAPGATPLGARFESGVVLQSAILSTRNPQAGSDLTLELDWTRDAEMEPGLGVFVHFEPSSGKGMNGDHVLLSAVLDLEKAPAGKTLRDVMPVWVPEDSRGQSWKVYAGLWAVRRGGQRVHVVDAGTSNVEGDRVLVGTFTAR